MKTPEISLSRSRYLIPLAFLALALLSLLVRWRFPHWLGDDIYLFPLFLVTCFILTATAWHISMNQRRWPRFSRRLARVPLLATMLILGMIVFLLDLSTNLIWEFLVMARRHLLLMGSAAAVILILFLLALASRNPRSILRYACIVLLNICLTAFFLECAFRFLLLSPKVPRTEEQFQQQIASTWPNKIQRPKDTNTFRILGLADSFGQSENHRNYHYILERDLNEERPNVEIVNFSMGEYEPKEELELLERFGPSYQPDLVLHGFFVGNDFSIPEGRLYSFRNISTRVKGGLRGWFPHHFASREWFRRLIVLLNEKAKQSKDDSYSPSGATFSRERFMEIERRRLRICRIDGPAERFRKTISMLKRIRSRVNAMDAMLVMVIHPDQYQVEPDLFNETCKEFALNPSDYDLRKPQRIISAYCARNGIACIDLLPAFREHGFAGGLYIPRNTHYNDRGNRHAAVEISRSLLKLLPSKTVTQP